MGLKEMINAREAMATLIRNMIVLFILLSLLRIQVTSIIRNAMANIVMRAGTGKIGFKFLILFSL